MTSLPKVLVVDDDPGMRLSLVGIIEDEGYEVSGAEDGYEALDLARDTCFDLIFMDIKMSGINGVETYRRIKKLSPNSIVVMMTGFSVEELVKQALDEGAYAVLYKPLVMEQVLVILRSVNKSTFVLVVDDLAAHRAPLIGILEEQGYSVSEADDGSHAVQMASWKHYDVVLMDINLPGLDGIKAFEEIRAANPQTKVVFITGYELNGPARAALDADGYTVITKPVDPNHMLTLIKAISAKSALRTG